MSVIRKGWSKLGWLLAVLICFIASLWLLILVLLILLGIIFSLLGQPEAVLIWGFVAYWLETGFWLGAAIIAYLLLAALGLFIIDLLFNVLVNLFTPGVSTWTALKKDLADNAGYVIDGLKEGLKDVVVETGKKVKETLDTAGKWINDGIDWVKGWFKKKPPGQ